MFIPVWLALLLFGVAVSIFGVAIEQHEKSAKLQERVEERELSVAVRKSETVALRHPVVPVADGLIG